MYKNASNDFENLFNKRKSIKSSKHFCFDNAGEEVDTATVARYLFDRHELAHTQYQIKQRDRGVQIRHSFGNFCANSCTRTNVTIHHTHTNLRLKVHRLEDCPWPTQESGIHFCL